MEDFPLFVSINGMDPESTKVIYDYYMSMISVGTSPVELSALTRGQHELLISPVGCSGGSKTLSVKFSTKP